MAKKKKKNVADLVAARVAQAVAQNTARATRQVTQQVEASIPESEKKEKIENTLKRLAAAQKSKIKTEQVKLPKQTKLPTPKTGPASKEWKEMHRQASARSNYAKKREVDLARAYSKRMQEDKRSRKTNIAGMSNTEMDEMRRRAGMNTELAKALYATDAKGVGRNRTGVDRGLGRNFGKKVAKAEEETAKQNPFIYGFYDSSIPGGGRKTTEYITGEKVNTDDVLSSKAGRAGQFAGEAFKYAFSGMGLEGGIAKGALKGGAKLASTKAGKAALKALAKRVGKSKLLNAAATRTAAKAGISRGAAKKLIAKQAREYAARRIADPVAGSFVNALYAGGESKDGKDFVKNLAQQSAMDAVFGGAFEAAPGVAKAAGKGGRKLKGRKAAARRKQALADAAKRADDLRAQEKNATRKRVNARRNAEAYKKLLRFKDRTLKLPEESLVGSRRIQPSKFPETVDIKLGKPLSEKELYAKRKEIKARGKKLHLGKKVGIKGTFEDGRSYVARLNSTGFGKTTSNTPSNEMVGIVENLDRIVENGRYIESSPPKKEGHLRSDLFETDVRFNGEPATVRTRINKAREGNKQYDSYVYPPDRFSSKKKREGTSDTSSQNVGTGEADSLLKEKIPQSEEKGKSKKPPKNGQGPEGGQTDISERGSVDDDLDTVRQMTREKTHITTKEDAPSLKQSAGALGRFFKKHFVNTWDAVETASRKLSKEGQERVDASVQKVRAASEAANDTIGRRQTTYFREDAGDSLKDIDEAARKKGDDFYKDLQEYMYHLHNIDRVKEGKPVFEGVTAKQSKEIADKVFAERPEVKEFADRYYQFAENERQRLVDAGVWTKEMKEDFEAKYPNYVPTYRVGDYNAATGANAKGFQVEGVHAAKGSNRDIAPLSEQFKLLVTSNRRREAYNDLINTMAKEFDVEIGKGEGAKIEDLFDAADAMTVRDGAVNADFLKKGDGGTYRITGYKDGEPFSYEVGKDVFEAFTSGMPKVTDDALTNLLKRGAGATNRVFKALITNWNPMFIVRNGAKDFQEALITSTNLKGLIKNYPNALKEMAQDSDMWKMYKAGGGLHSSIFDLSTGYKKGNWLKRTVGDRIENVNMAVEQAPRFAEFLSSMEDSIKKNPDMIKDGKVVDQKAYLAALDRAQLRAADVTVNFGRSGDWGRFLNSYLVPFFNPAMQGTSKTARLVMDARTAGDYGKLLAKCVAFGVAPMVLNELVYAGDEEYERLNDNLKDRYFLLKGKNGTWYRIPHGRITQIFGSAGQNVLRAIQGRPTTWVDSMGTALAENAPSNPLESNLASPLMLAANNKTWYGGNIDSQYELGKRPDERYDADTTETSKRISRLAVRAGIKSDMVSPRRLDYLVDAYSGVIGDVAMPIDTRASGGKNPVKNVLARNFTTNATRQNKLQTEYYTKKADLAKWSPNSKEAKAISSWDNRVNNLNRAIEQVKGSDIDQKKKDAAVDILMKRRNTILSRAIDGKTSVSDSGDVEALGKALGYEDTIKLLNPTSKSGTTPADVKTMELYKAGNGGKIDDDFWKGYIAVRDAKARVKAVGTSNNDLTSAVALANAGVPEKVSDAYGFTNKGSRETKDKYRRAQEYFANGGTMSEYLRMQRAIKDVNYTSMEKEENYRQQIRDIESGKKTVKDGRAEIKKLQSSLNTSYTVRAMVLAQMGASNRDYALFDIKRDNVQKGKNLAAAGVKVRDISKMKRAADTDGNGYLKKAEAQAFLNSEANPYTDRAQMSAIYAAMMPNSKKNPYGTFNATAKEAADKKVQAKYKSIKPKMVNKTITETKKARQAAPKAGNEFTRSGFAYDPRTMTAEEMVPLLEKNNIYNYGLAGQWVTKKTKKKVKMTEDEAKKFDKGEDVNTPTEDNAEIPQSKSSGGGWYGYRRYRRSRGYGGKRSKTPPKLKALKAAQKALDTTRYKSASVSTRSGGSTISTAGSTRKRMTDEEIRANMRRMLRNRG